MKINEYSTRQYIWFSPDSKDAAMPNKQNKLVGRKNNIAIRRVIKFKRGAIRVKRTAIAVTIMITKTMIIVEPCTLTSP